MSPQTCLTSCHSLTRPKQFLGMEEEGKICTSALPVKKREVVCDLPRPPHEQVAETSGDPGPLFPIPAEEWVAAAGNRQLGISGWPEGSAGDRIPQEGLCCSCASAAPGEELSTQHCFHSSSAALIPHHWPWRGLRALSDFLGGDLPKAQQRARQAS